MPPACCRACWPRPAPDAGPPTTAPVGTPRPAIAGGRTTHSTKRPCRTVARLLSHTLFVQSRIMVCRIRVDARHGTRRAHVLRDGERTSCVRELPRRWPRSPPRPPSTSTPNSRKRLGGGLPSKPRTAARPTTATTMPIRRPASRTSRTRSAQRPADGTGCTRLGSSPAARRRTSSTSWPPPKPTTAVCAVEPTRTRRRSRTT